MNSLVNSLMKTDKSIRKIFEESSSEWKKIIDNAFLKLDTGENLTDEEIQAFKDHYSFLTANGKTGISLDFLPGIHGSCGRECSYCYVDDMMRIYDNYKIKVKRLFTLIKKYPDIYEEVVKHQLEKFFCTKDVELKTSGGVRWFGSGDFTPEMLSVIENLADIFEPFGKKFYIISKALPSTTPQFIEQLAGHSNIIINLSFDWTSRNIVESMTGYLTHENIQMVYTLDEGEFLKVTDEYGEELFSYKETGNHKVQVLMFREVSRKQSTAKVPKTSKQEIQLSWTSDEWVKFLSQFNAVFNVDKSEKALYLYRKTDSIHFCDCDLKLIPLKNACSHCQVCMGGKGKAYSPGYLDTAGPGKKPYVAPYTVSKDIEMEEPTRGKKYHPSLENKQRK